MKFKRYGWLFLGVAFLVTFSTSCPVQAMEEKRRKDRSIARVIRVLEGCFQRIGMPPSQASPSGSGQSQETVALAARLRDLVAFLSSSPSEELVARYGHPSHENVLLKIRRVFEAEGADALDADLVVEGIEGIVNFARSTDNLGLRTRVFEAIEEAVTTIAQPVLLLVQEQLAVLALWQLAEKKRLSPAQAAAMEVLSVLKLRLCPVEQVLGEEGMLQLVSALCLMLLAEGGVDIPSDQHRGVDAGALSILADQLYELGERDTSQGENVADMVKRACSAAKKRWPRADNIRDLCASVARKLEGGGVN